MQIISKVSLTFHDAEIVKNEQTGFFQNKINEAVAVVPSEYPQVVPDWVRDNDLFKFALIDGTVTEIVDNRPTKPLAAINTAGSLEPARVKQADILQAPERSNPWPTEQDVKGDKK